LKYPFLGEPKEILRVFLILEVKYLPSLFISTCAYSPGPGTRRRTDCSASPGNRTRSDHPFPLGPTQSYASGEGSSVLFSI
jgi:hypothetical protein